MEKLKVLIVNDSSVMRKIVESFASGRVDIAAVYEASNGAEALGRSPKWARLISSSATSICR